VATIGPRAELGFALATRLIADRGRRFTRRHLTALFWPDVEEQRAAHSLSEALHRLRARGVPVQGDSTQAVWIDRDAVTLDVERIPAMRPAELLKCDFTVLPGFEPRGAPALLDWADEYRHQLTIQTVRNLATPIATAEGDGDWETVLTLAERALRLDAEDPASLDARARAAQALRERRSFRGTERPAADSTQIVIRETFPSRCDTPRRSGAPGAQPDVFVGRQDELSALTGAWSQAAAGRGRSVRISGQSGLGKSRLLHEFCSRARRTGGVVAEVSCEPPDLERPMSALMRLVPRLRRLPGAAGCSPDVIPYLDRLTEYDAGGGGLPDPSDVPYLSTCVERAVEELVDAVAEEQPLVLAVDDAQWLDAESARLFDVLARRAMSGSILVVLVSCDTRTDSGWLQCSDAIPIRLAPLSDDASRLLVDALAKQEALDPSESIVDWIVRAGEGHPFWLTELVQHWVATGDGFSVPQSLVAMLRDRIARLSPLARRVLQTVALLGQGATLNRLRRVVGAEYTELLEALEFLGAAGLLTVDDKSSTAGTPELTCRHDAVADAALAQLTPPARALLHQQIALVLDEEFAHTASAELLWARAAHWTAGDRADRLVDVGLACVRHLVEIGLVDAAIAACRDLGWRCAEADDTNRVNRALAEILHLSRRWQEFETVVNAISPSPGAHDHVELLSLDSDWQQRRDCRSTLATALHCAAAVTASHVHRIRAATLALKIATNLGDIAAIEQARDCALGMFGTEPPTTDELTFRMIHAAIDGCGDTAVQHARMLLEHVARSACEDRLRLMLNCAVALSRGGAVAEANDVCEQVFTAAPRSGLPRLSLDACRRGALMMLDHGRFEDAHNWVARTEHATSAVLPTVQQGAMAVIAAKLALHGGDPRAALRILMSVRDDGHAERIPMFDAAVLAVRIVAQVSLRSNPVDVASDVGALDKLEAQLMPLGGQDYEAVALAVGRAYVDRNVDAEVLFERYLSSRRDPYPLPEQFRSMLSNLCGALRG